MYWVTLLRLAGIGLYSLAAYGTGDGGLAVCKKVAEDTARLACYDRLADSPVAADTQAIPVAPFPAAATPSPETLFGRDTVQSEDMVRRAAGIGRLDEIAAGVVAVEYGPTGKAVLTLDNDQVWSQLDTSKFRIKSGNTVRIRRALLGSYLLTAGEGKTSIRVRRTK
jgi:hypothetical protein